MCRRSFLQPTRTIGVLGQNLRISGYQTFLQFCRDWGFDMEKHKRITSELERSCLFRAGHLKKVIRTGRRRNDGPCRGLRRCPKVVVTHSHRRLLPMIVLRLLCECDTDQLPKQWECACSSVDSNPASDCTLFRRSVAFYLS